MIVRISEEDLATLTELAFEQEGELGGLLQDIVKDMEPVTPSFLFELRSISRGLDTAGIEYYSMSEDYEDHADAFSSGTMTGERLLTEIELCLKWNEREFVVNLLQVLLNDSYVLHDNTIVEQT